MAAYSPYSYTHTHTDTSLVTCDNTDHKWIFALTLKVESRQVSRKVTLSADQRRICHCFLSKSPCILYLSFPGIEYVPLFHRDCTLCQIGVYYASQPAVSVKCSVNSKTTVRDLAPSIIVMLHIIMSVAYYLNLLVFSFSAILDRRLTEPQCWLSLLRL